MAAIKAGKLDAEVYFRLRTRTLDTHAEALGTAALVKAGLLDGDLYFKFRTRTLDTHEEALEAVKAVKAGKLNGDLYFNLRTRTLDSHEAAMAGALISRSVTELEMPEYCRINDKDLNALTEEVMTRESPRDPVTNNLFIELAAATPDGKPIKAKIINVRHGHPGDQFHIEVYAAGSLVFKSARQDNPIFIGFQLDGVPYSLVCFEDIR